MEDENEQQPNELLEAVRDLLWGIGQLLKAILVLCLNVLAFICQYASMLLFALAAGIKSVAPILAAVLYYLVCVGVPVAAIASMLLPVCNALGGDFPAMVASMPVLLAPSVVALVAGFGFPGLLLAGVITYALAKIIVLATPVIRSIIVLATIASIITFKLLGGDNSNEE